MTWKHIRTLIAMCGLIGGAIGMTITIAGVFYSPIATDLGIGRGTVAMTTTICSIMGAVVGLFLPKLINEKNLKIVIILATIALVGGSYAMSLCSSTVAFYLISFIRGLGSGCVNFILATTVLNNWFYAKRGLVTSLIMAFTGVPGVLFSNIITSVIQNNGWRTGYVVLAVGILLFCLPAILFPLSIKPETQGEKPYGYEEYMSAKQEGKITTINPSESFSYASPLFILVLIYAAACTMVPAVPSHFPGFADSIGKSASLGALMLSVSSACNIGGKILYGTLTDKIGNLKTIILMIAVCLVGNGLLMFMRSDIALLVGAGLFTFTYSISSVGISMICIDLFGMNDYGKVYPVVNLLGGLLNAVTGTMVGMVYDISGSYIPVFYAVIALQIVNIVCLVSAYRIQSRQSSVAAS